MTKVVKSNEENNLKKLIPPYGKERLKIPISLVKGTKTAIVKKTTLNV